eukprot:TRINITY_DN12196_c0_g1_i1.p2 TRINITY_DN12196_c0_g1~~TRINITY_DN12196_c0_g1_i1.p2  ORF type:complete len:53 (-),score=14.30 TRINITY_DN12196_c0_g1_i1:534-692(-)
MQTGRDISPFSPYDEAEVLLPPMTMLQVKEVREDETKTMIVSKARRTSNLEG